MTRSIVAQCAIIIFAALALGACSKSQPNYGLNLAKTGQDGGIGQDSEGGPITPGSPRDFVERVGDTVLFLTDSAQLSPEGEQTLSGQIRWLDQYPQYRILIEGHADERGTREYNIALGAQRAAASKHYMISNGVDPRRIRTISYGKERPVAVCPDISCWSQNRRTVTVLDRGDAVASN